METIYTTCRYCEANCGLAVQVEHNRVVKIVADKENPQTWRDICAKGLTAHELVEHPRRITAPMKRVGNRYVEVSYEEAVNGIAAGLQQLKDRFGPDSIGYYHGNPLGFTSGIIFALGFIDGLGTRNRFNVGSVDQNNNHVVSKALFDLPYVPFNPDIDHCDYLLMLGMDPVESKFSWLGNASDGWQRALARQRQGAKLVVVDPRRTRTASHADLHLSIVPGQDWALLLAMLQVIMTEDLGDKAALASLPADQLQAFRSILASAIPEDLATRCGIALETIRQIARDYAAASGAMCLTQTGISMHTTGTIGHWLGLVLDIVTGHLDRPGGRRFDTGYINMTAFAARQQQAERRSRVRGQATVMGNQSLCELPDEILTPGAGQIKGMIVHAGNPVVSGPNGAKLDQALEQLDLLIAVDLVQRESHRHAHWLIPGVHWLERGELPFNLAGGMDQPIIQYSQQALQAPPAVVPEWQFFTDLALAMKVPMMAKRGINTAIRVSRWLARIADRSDWAVSPALLEKLMLKSGKQVSWQQLQQAPHGLQYADKRYGQLQQQMGQRRIQIAPQTFCTELSTRLRETPAANPEYPFTLVSKRSLNMMNSWLMDLPNMQKREQGNGCEINPQDAARLGIEDGAEVLVSSATGTIHIAASYSDTLPIGVLCIQHGWGSRVFDPGNPDNPPWQAGVNRNLLVDNRAIDPFSGTPNLNSTRVNVALAGPGC